MASPSETARAAILGVPFDPNKKPDRVMTVKAFEQLDAKVFGVTAGAIIRDSLTALLSMPSAPARQMAWVFGDATVGNNGIYENAGTLNSPTWQRRGDLPFGLISFINIGDGTADKIIATSSLPEPTASGVAIISFNTLAANTGPVTFNGTPVRSNSGSALVANAWGANAIIYMRKVGDHYRLMNDQNGAALVAAAEGFVDEAEGWADAAEGFKNEAQAARDEATEIVGFDGVVATRQEALSACRAAKTLGHATPIINGWVDGFGGNDGVDEILSSGYVFDTDRQVISVGIEVEGEAAINGNAGTPIGTMTANGSLSQAFDGTTNKGFTTSVYSDVQVSGSTGGYVGKNFSSSPKRIARAMVYGPNNNGFVSTNNPSVGLTIFGKNGSAPANLSDGTLLASVTITDTADESAGRELISNDPNTEWDYVWVRVARTASNDRVMVAQLVLYEPVLLPAQDAEVVTIAKAADFEPEAIVVGVEIEPVDTIALGTDLTISASRDGGATFTSATTITQRHSLGSRRYIEAIVDVSGQPDGAEIRSKITSTNSKAANLAGIMERWSA